MLIAIPEELKWLAVSYVFGAFLGVSLRDRFVAGLCDKRTQAELLKNNALNFTSAYDIAKCIELAFKQLSKSKETFSTPRHKPDRGRRPK